MGGKLSSVGGRSVASKRSHVQLSTAIARLGTQSRKKMAKKSNKNEPGIKKVSIPIKEFPKIKNIANWSKVKNTVKKFYKLCQGDRVILLFENSRLISSNAQFFDITESAF
ncbi:hypothetical protein NDI49_19500 [Trichocoleus sp. ST-U3]